MARRASNNKGFSLIELLIAMAIIEVSMLALLTSMLLIQRTNLQNELRNTSIRLTNQTAEALLALPVGDTEMAVGTTYTRDPSNPNYTDQNSKGFPQPIQNVRGYQQQYSITWKVDPYSSGNAVQVTITVSYTYRGQTYTNNAVIYPTGSV